MASVNHMPHQRDFGGLLIIRVQWILASQNKNIIDQIFPGVLNSRSRGEILQQFIIWYPIKQR